MSVERTATPTSCPSEETLTLFLERRLSEAEQADLTIHVDVCARCRVALGVLAEVEPDFPEHSELAAEPAHLPVGTRLGPYRLERWVAGGSMGDVYAAFDDRLRRRVALKRVRRRARSASAEERLLLEAQALARLRHPNVVSVYDVGVTEGRAWIAMEYVDGVTLREHLRTSPGTQMVATLLHQAALALHAAHAAGIVHRDFKPENVLVAADGTVRVTDFGLAEVGDSTQEVVIAGTPAYMAPEQAAGAAVDSRADQYAFCITAVEALTGQRPTRGAAPDWSHSRVPERARLALRRGLSVLPAARFPSMEALDRAMLPPPRRRAWWAALLALLVLAAAASAAVWRASLCSSGPSRVAEVWNEERRVALARAVDVVGTPLAKETGGRLPALFDAWATQWAEAFRSTCEATRLRGEQSEVLLDRQVRCLEQQRRQMKGLVELLGSADKTSLENAFTAYFSVPSPEGCLLARGGAATVSLPADPALAARVDAVRARLDHATILSVAGAREAAVDEVRSLEGEVAAIGFKPLGAQYLLELGVAQSVADQAAAEETLERAFNAAVALGEDELAFDATVERAHVADTARGDFATAQRHLDTAKAWLDRLGAPAEKERAWNHGLAEVALHSGDSSRARGPMVRVLELTRAAHPENPPDLVDALCNMALLEYSTLHAVEAEPYAREAVAVSVRSLGEQHAFTVAARQVLGRVLMELGQPEASLAEQRQALQSMRAENPEGSEVGDLELEVGQGLLELSRHEEAEPHLREALRIFEAAKLDEQRASALMALGMLRIDQGRFDDARTLLAESLSLREHRLGPNHRDVAATVYQLGELGLATSDGAAALKHFTRAASIDEHEGGELLAVDHVSVGRALQVLGRWKEAEATTRQAIDELSDANPKTRRLSGARLGLVDLLLHRKAWSEAAAVLDRVEAEVLPTQWLEHVSLSWDRCQVLEGQHRLPEAIAEAKRTLALLAQKPRFAAASRAEVEAWARAHGLPTN